MREPDRGGHLHHPWRRFGQLTDWSLRWAQLPEGVMGATCHTSRTVVLALGMSQAERRCTIAHETEHILRGPGGPAAAAREERAIDRTVGGLLLPRGAEVVDAVVAARGHLETAADGLWVDDYLLQVRLTTLSATEQQYAAQRLAAVLA